MRESVLGDLAQRIGDTALPLDLLAAGTFANTQPESGRQIEDRKAVIELSGSYEGEGEGDDSGWGG